MQMTAHQLTHQPRFETKDGMNADVNDAHKAHIL
jgi:hypothetical protein